MLGSAGKGYFATTDGSPELRVICTPAPFDTVSEAVSLKRRSSVAVITVFRPEVRNAWDVPTYRKVVTAITAANADNEIGAIMLTAIGPVYSAGVDLKAKDEPLDEEGRQPTVGTLSMAKSTNWISTLMESKPIIVAIDGAAVGLGATHPLAADIRMMSTSAYFQFPFLKLGSLPELGSSALLQQLVGSGRARELILTGRQLGAEEALHIGLVSAVYETSELFDAALRVADAIACLPREQVRITRQLLNENGRNCDATVALEREAKAFVALARSGGSASPRRRNPTT